MHNLIITEVLCAMVIWHFFFNDTATTEIYTLSLHDALPIWKSRLLRREPYNVPGGIRFTVTLAAPPDSARPSGCGPDRKSTRLNSSHSQISYAVFCLKKKKQTRVDSLNIRHNLSSSKGHKHL